MSRRPVEPRWLPGIEGGEALFSSCRRYRYRLERRWDRGLPLSVWVMLNPSRGDAWRMDPTLWRVFHFSKQHGAGGFLVVNLYAYISSSPDALEMARRQGFDVVGPDNREHLRNALLKGAREPAGYRLLAAWGNWGHATPEAEAFRVLAAQRGIAVYCLGINGTGSPRHPLHAPAFCPLALYPSAADPAWAQVRPAARR